MRWAAEIDRQRAELERQHAGTMAGIELGRVLKAALRRYSPQEPTAQA